MGKGLLYALVVGGLGFGLMLQGRLVDAGPLSPEGPPASSSVTLNALGEKLDDLDSKRIRPIDLPNARDFSTAGSVLLKVSSETLGDIQGGVSSPGAEGAMNVLGFSHEVVSPRDAASGLPTGKRQHKPISITKPIDKATPLLMHALVSNDNLPSCTLEFYRQSATGETEKYYTIKLTNASISSIVCDVANFETVSFTYQKIEWTYVEGGIMAEDDWESPVS